MLTTTIVVPCYNEARRLDRTAFEVFLEGDEGPTLLFVDDGSTDDTLDVLQSLVAFNPSRAAVHVVEPNRGKAEAVRRGMLRALSEGARYVGFWDGDLSTPLDQISTFVDLLDDAPDVDVVMGARVRMLGRQIDRFGPRHLVGRAYATAASLVLALPTYDTQCGAKLFRSSPALEHALGTPFASRWGFDVELLRRLQNAWGERGIDRILEVPLQEWRDPGRSKVSLLQGALAFLALIRFVFPSAHGLPLRNRPDTAEPDRIDERGGAF